MYCLAYSPLMAGIWPWGRKNKLRRGARRSQTLGHEGRPRPCRSSSADEPLRSVAFAPDGRTLAAASREGVYLVGPLHPIIRAIETISIGADGRAWRRTQDRFWPNGSGQEAETIVADPRTLHSMFFARDDAFSRRPRLSHVVADGALLVGLERREKCRWLLKSWLERDGMSLLRCRMIPVPVLLPRESRRSPGTRTRGLGLNFRQVLVDAGVRSA